MMRAPFRRLPVILLLLAFPILPYAQGQERGTPLEPAQRTLVFSPSSSKLRVAETAPVRVIPGDIVVLEIPEAMAGERLIAQYHCTWTDEKKILGIKVGEDPKSEDPQVTGRLGEQIVIRVAVPGNEIRQLAGPKPHLRLLASRPGTIQIDGIADTQRRDKPNPKAHCDRIPSPEGEAWYRISIQITRFPGGNS